MGKCWISKFICFWSPFWYYNSILVWVADVMFNSGYLACRIGIFFVFLRGTKHEAGVKRETRATESKRTRRVSRSWLAWCLPSLAWKTRETTLVLHATVTSQRPVSRKSRKLSGPERCFVLVVFAFKIKVSIIFKNNTRKLSVNEAKLTGLWAWNCATIQQVVILKFSFWPEKFRVFRETGARSLV